MKEYKDFLEFYNKSLELSKIAKNTINNSKGAILYARKSFNKNDLNSFYIIGNLSKEQENLLKSNTNIIKFSIDSFVKNIIKHPEIEFQDYYKINDIIIKPDKIRISKSNNNSILLLKKENKYYQVVIKTTIDKNENYLTSFRRLSEEEFNKQ